MFGSKLVAGELGRASKPPYSQSPNSDCRKKIREHRSRYESFQAFAVGKVTVGDAVEVYLQKARVDVLLKPRSKDYREKTVDVIRRSWPSLFETDVRKISERDCENWLVRFQ